MSKKPSRNMWFDSFLHMSFKLSVCFFYRPPLLHKSAIFQLALATHFRKIFGDVVCFIRVEHVERAAGRASSPLPALVRHVSGVSRRRFALFRIVVYRIHVKNTSLGICDLIDFCM